MRMPPYITLLVILFTYTPYTVSQELVTDVSCVIIGKTDQSEVLRGIAEKLVTIRKNQYLDTTALRESLDALQLCRLFEQVEIEQTGNSIQFLLTPAQYVRDIRISGESPLFEDDVAKAMSSYPGDMYTDDLLLINDSIITALYRREGFVSPNVKTVSRVHRSGSNKLVHVSIKAGPYLRLRTLDIRGNNALSDFKLKRSMKSWRASLFPGSAGRFIAAVFREDVKTLINMYRSMGFADVQVRDSISTDSCSQAVNVILSIDEGTRYSVKFSPWRDRKISKRTLRKDISIFKAGNRNNLGLRRSVKAMEKRLREAGYTTARVEASDTTIKRRKFTEKQVHFSIKRGPRTTVSSITVTGAVELDASTILGQMLHVDKGNKAKRAYNPDILQEDIFAIQMLYRSHGFLKATITPNVQITGTSAAITINIQEGPQTIIGDILINVDRFTQIDKKNAVTIRKGDVYISEQLKRNARVLQAAIAEQGYPHATVIPVVSMNSDSSSAGVEFRIHEGPHVTLGMVHYLGAFRTQKKVLQKELKARPGQPLSLQNIVNTQKGIRDLGLFSSVRFRTIGLQEKRDTVHVFVQVAEKRPFYGSLSGGYQSDKGPFVQAKAGDRNILGLNKDAWVSGEISLVGFRGETALIEPRLFGSSVHALLGAFGEKRSELNQEWSTTAYGISTGLTAPFNKHLILGLGTSYERRRLSFSNGSAPTDSGKLSNEQEPRNIIMVKPSFSWDRRDSFTRPRKGVLVGSTVDISKSIGTDIDNIIKIQLETRGYVTPFSTLTIAGAVRAGYLHTYGRASGIPADRRFYLGGSGDVRGFDENLFDSSGAKTSFSASIEARIGLGFNFELALFTDVGRLEDDIVSLSAEQFRFSAGTGLRYNTPIGPIGILYGWKLARKADEPVGKLHFSLGYTF